MSWTILNSVETIKSFWLAVQQKSKEHELRSFMKYLLGPNDSKLEDLLHFILL